MSTTQLPHSALVYVDELRRALRGQGDADEIVAEIEDHLLAAISDSVPDEREHAIRSAMERLGSVDQIAAAARQRDVEAGPAPARGSWRWVLAVLGAASVLLAIALPPVGAAVGAICAIASVIAWRSSNTTDRGVFATALVLAVSAVLIAGFLLALLFPATSAPVPTQTLSVSSQVG